MALDGSYALRAFDDFTELRVDEGGVVLVDLTVSADLVALTDWIDARDAKATTCPIVVVNGGDLAADLRSLVRDGHLSAVSSDISSEGLRATIRAALAGLTVLDGPLAGILTDTSGAPGRWSGRWSGEEGTGVDSGQHPVTGTDIAKTEWNTRADGVGAGGHDGASSPSPAAWSQLSTRELDVLELVARGMTNKQIGRTLEISDGTVRVHVREVLRKLHRTNRTQAALAYMDARAGGVER